MDCPYSNTSNLFNITKLDADVKLTNIVTNESKLHLWPTKKYNHAQHHELVANFVYFQWFQMHCYGGHADLVFCIKILIVAANNGKLKD